MGSFPIILKFDSLGQYFIYPIIKLCSDINIKLYLLLVLFSKQKIKKFNTFKKFSISFDTKNSNCIAKKFFFPKNSFFQKILGVKLIKLSTALISLFRLNKNILLVDYNYNYNYLPIQHADVINRSSKKVRKIINYFSIGLIFFLNLNNKYFLFKKYSCCNVMTISLNTISLNTTFDFNLNIKPSPLINYILYIYILDMYLRFKN